MRAPALANSTVLGWLQSGLVHRWVQAKVAHELLGGGEPTDVSNRREQAHGDSAVDAGNRQ